jgi:antitoxin Phd
MWQVQEAKAKFSELLDKTLIEEWERLKQRARPTLKDLLLSDENRFEIDLPPRGSLKLRPVIRFEDE